MPALLVCSTCQTKLKIPDQSSVKALRCPKCKAVVPIPTPKATAEPEKKVAVGSSKAPPSADDEEELEVNEAVDDEEDSNEEAVIDADSPLAQLGFAGDGDPYQKASLPEEARKTIEKSFLKKEKALWAGRPSAKLIESKAWIGLVVGPIAVLVGVGVCLVASALSFFVVSEPAAKIVVPFIASIFCLVFCAVGILAVVFRKRIGGNVAACYVVTDKGAYIYDGNTQSVRRFAPASLVKLKCEESSSFPGAGDLIFTYELHGAEGVGVNQELKEKYQGTAVGFLNIEQLHLVRKMIQEVLVDPHFDEAKEKQKAKKKKKKSRPRWSL